MCYLKMWNSVRVLHSVTLKKAFSFSIGKFIFISAICTAILYA